MTAVAFVALAFFVGTFIGAAVSVARDYNAEQADADAHRDDVVRAWREGQHHGERRGYADGWLVLWLQGIPCSYTLRQKFVR